MKNLFVIMLAAAFLACGTRPEATLDGVVTGVTDGTIVAILDGTYNQVGETATIVDGKFHFDFPEAYPSRYYLTIDGINELKPFIIEPGAIVATIDVAEKSIVFTGTPTNDGLSRQAAFDNPNTILAAYLTYSTAYNLTTAEQVDEALAKIAGAPANAFTDGLKKRREALAATAVGVEAPDFTQGQPDGTPLTLSSLRGKLVLIDFWASWCAPCRAENPNVVKAYNKYHDKGFEILGVSLDGVREQWLEAIEEDGLTWLHVSDLQAWNNAVAQQYAVRSVPHTVLVGADGVIIAKNLRGAALEAKVAEVLGEVQ